MARDVDVIHRERILDSYLKVERWNFRHSAHEGGWVGPMLREVVQRPNAVAVLPYDPVAEKILLIEQFRLPAHISGMPAWQRELIAGLNDKNENPEEIARREAIEEANCPLGELKLAYHYLLCPGMSTETLYSYVAKFDSSKWQAGVHGLAVEHEDIRASLHDVAEIPEILATGHTGNVILIVALQWFLLNHAKLRAEWA
jgi:ADP-ribose pyrophosphatase